MNLDESTREELLRLALSAAKTAAAYIASRVGEELEVRGKVGGSSLASQVVTEVDLQSQRLILDILENSTVRYDLGLLTEESEDDASRHRREWFWCIDPLDGTLAFTENIAGYSVSIALVSREGKPEIGVIVDPVSGAVFHATRGGGARRDGEEISLVPGGEGSAGRPLTLVMDRSFENQASYPLIVRRLEKATTALGMEGLRTIKQGGAARNACWVLEHAPAVYFKFPKSEQGGGSLWDYAAATCLFDEIEGAVASDIHGDALKLNRVGTTFMNEEGILFATGPELAAVVRDLFRAGW